MAKANPRVDDFFPRLVKEKRTQLKMTQGQFAKLFDTQPHTVSRWQSGEYLPNKKALVFLANYCYHKGFYGGTKVRCKKTTPTSPSRKPRKEENGQ